MNPATVIIGFYALGFLAVIVIIILLIVKRIKERKEETFEKRDN